MTTTVTWMLCLLFPALHLAQVDNTKLSGALYEIMATTQWGSALCSNKAQHMFNQFLSDKNTLMAVLRSGKGLNDLGDYENCNKDKTTRYILLQVNGVAAKLAMGICGPAECVESDYDPLKPHIAKLITSIMAGDTTTPVTRNFTSDDIDLVDPSLRRSQEPFYTAGFFVTVVFFAIILTLNVDGVVTNKMQGAGKRRELWARVMGCFDFAKNMKAVFAISAREDQDLKVFNGLRVLSMLWVILGHTFYYARNSYLVNVLDVVDFSQTFRYAYILSAPYSVDVFFFLSGFLASYLLLRQLKASHGNIPLWYLYLHRVLRIMPMYVSTMLIFCFFMPPLGTGPGYYNFYLKADVDCPKYGYLHLLFVNNFAPYADDCLGYTWYLANDMQFFIITPILVYIYYKRRALGYFLLGLLGLSCVVIGLVLCFRYNLSASYLKYSEDYYTLYYTRPYNRISPYLIGVVIAFLFAAYKDGESNFFTSFTKCLKAHSALRWLCYIGSTVGIFWLIQAIYWLNKYPDSWTGWPDALFLILSKPLFVVCLFFFIYPSMLGHGKWIQTILGNDFFVPFARTTFGAYLLHPLLMFYLFLNEKKGLFYEYDVLIIKFFGFAVIAYTMSIVATVLLESPVVSFDREFLRPITSPQQKRREAEETSLMRPDPHLRTKHPIEVITLPLGSPSQKEQLN